MTAQIDIKKLRKDIGWTQDSLAKFLCVETSAISRMERANKLRGPAVTLLQALADAAETRRPNELCSPETLGTFNAFIHPS